MSEYEKLFTNIKNVLHQTKKQLALIRDDINSGKINLYAKKIQIDEGAHLKAMFLRTLKAFKPNVARPSDMEISTLNINVKFKELTVTEQKIWEVFFDHKEEGSDKGHRIDPFILDLNKDGKFDITGANQEGDGRVDGQTVNFDIDPSKQSWKYNSPGHRPGWYEGRASHLVDPLPNGKAIYNTGKTENFGPKGVWIDNPKLGQSAKIYNAMRNG